MKRLTRLSCLLIAALLLLIMFTPDKSGVNLQQGLVAYSDIAPDDNYRTWYEIFVYSFCDSNGDGIGDLQGVISKLDYLQELGVNGIWLMPIHPSPSYHKYDVLDYYAIDPQYGTMADFEELMQQCRARDIRVILDLVLNHTSAEHPWFQEACKALASQPTEQSQYVDYYFFTQQPQTNDYYPVEGTEWQYEGKFWSGMPDLNLDNPALREEIRDIMTFWMNKGVSGFRLDAAKEYFSGQSSRNIQVLHFLTDTARSIDPDAYLVAEVWEGFTTIADYYASGIPSIFNFAFADGGGKITAVLRAVDNAKTVSSFATAQEKADKAFREKNPDYIDAPFLSNHDTGRIAGFCSRDERKMKLAGAMNLMMSGSAFVYYGEELGMPGSGNDPSKRAPMVWNEARNEGTTTPPPDCQLPDGYPLGSLETQREDPYSIYQYYRQAIALRQNYPVISHGIPTAETALNVDCVSATRKTWGEESCIILMNISTAVKACDLTSYDDYRLVGTLTVDEAPVTQSGQSLTLPPLRRGSAVPVNSLSKTQTTIRSYQWKNDSPPKEPSALTGIRCGFWAWRLQPWECWAGAFCKTGCWAWPPASIWQSFWNPPPMP